MAGTLSAIASSALATRTGAGASTERGLPSGVADACNGEPALMVAARLRVEYSWS